MVSRNCRFDRSGLFFDVIVAQISSPSVSKSVCMEGLMEFLIARSTPTPLEEGSFL